MVNPAALLTFKKKWEESQWSGHDREEQEAKEKGRNTDTHAMMM